jgi:Uma2 family endonuclease
MATVERLDLEKRPPLTVDEFYALAEEEGWDEDDRFELLDGEVVWMSPVNTPHVACVIRLNHVLLRRYSEDRALLSVQNPLQLGEFDLPQPDVTLLKPRDDFYAGGTPTPRDVLLLVEVADSSLRSDLGRKARIYAAAGVVEYWVVDLKDRALYVHCEPRGANYSTRTVHGPADQVHAAFAPEVTFSVGELIG